jgi:hypothetical protein
MTKWIALPAAFVAATALALNVEAAPKTTAKPTAPKAAKTTKAPSAKSTSAKTPTVKTKGGAATAKGPKTTTTTSAKHTGSPKKNTTTTTTASSTSTSTSTTTTTPDSTAWKPTNAVSEKLVGKPNQLARAKAVLPAGTDLNDATAGFKNFGQFNAAVNASDRLGIEFADLKAAMTGMTLEGEPTNEPTKSLGQAIKQLKPGVDADAEAAAATTQANLEAGAQ